MWNPPTVKIDLHTSHFFLLEMSSDTRSWFKFGLDLESIKAHHLATKGDTYPRPSFPCPDADCKGYWFIRFGNIQPDPVPVHKNRSEACAKKQKDFNHVYAQVLLKDCLDKGIRPLIVRTCSEDQAHKHELPVDLSTFILEDIIIPGRQFKADVGCRDTKHNFKYMFEVYNKHRTSEPESIKVRNETCQWDEFDCIASIGACTAALQDLEISSLPGVVSSRMELAAITPPIQAECQVDICILFRKERRESKEREERKKRELLELERVKEATKLAEFSVIDSPNLKGLYFVRDEKYRQLAIIQSGPDLMCIGAVTGFIPNERDPTPTSYLSTLVEPSVDELAYLQANTVLFTAEIWKHVKETVERAIEAKKRLGEEKKRLDEEKVMRKELHLAKVKEEALQQKRDKRRATALVKETQELQKLALSYQESGFHYLAQETQEKIALLQ